MKITGDLPEARWMYLKAGLFLLTGTLASVILLLENPSLRVAALLALAIWSFCRLYYFLFYVLEKYIDPGFRFDGLLPTLHYLLKKRRNPESQVKQPPGTRSGQGG